MKEVLDQVKNIQGKKYPGGVSKNATMYHELPFGELATIKNRRSKTLERIKQIASKVDVKDKFIIDLGCNVGGISIGLLKEGARKVVGFDIDLESIKVATAASDYLGLSKKAFFHKIAIDLDFLECLGKNLVSNIDIIVWLAQWHHLIRQHGFEYAKEILFEMSKRARTMVFEAEANNPQTKRATQKDVKRWLELYTVYENIKEYPSVGGWDDRSLFVCSGRNYVTKNNRGSKIVERISVDKVKKTYKHSFCDGMKRETKALNLLQNFNHFPKLLETGTDYITMSYVGKKIKHVHEYKNQMNDILTKLESVGIEHQDIGRGNLCTMDNKLYLIDFGSCKFKGEINPIITRSVKKGFTDKDMVNKIFNK